MEQAPSCLAAEMYSAVVAVAPAAVVFWLLVLAVVVLAARLWGRDMLQPRPLSLASVVVAVVPTVVLWLRLDFNLGPTPATVRGENTHSALILVSTAGGFLLVFALVGVVRHHPHPWRVLYAEAALLGAGLGLVASDSARYTERVTGGLLDNSTTVRTYHLWPLYPLWAIPLAVLLVQAWRLRSQTKRPSS